jgi:molecular chaperone GrpE
MKQEKENLEKDLNHSSEQKEQDKPSQDKKHISLEEKLIAAEAEIYSWKNKYAMMFADMDNLRKNQDKAFSEALRYRAEGFIDRLLPALESFHIALKNPVDDPKVKNYLVGFEYIYNQISQALADEGVNEIPVKINDPFDVKTMHAIEAEVSEGPPNRVLKILSPGFKLHDRVFKQILVIVSKQAEKKSQEVDQKDAIDNGKKAA